MSIKTKSNLVKKNFYFAIIVVALLFAVSFVIAAWDSSKASHGILYTDKIEPKTQDTIQISGNVDIRGQLLMAGAPFVSGYWKLNGNNVYYDRGNVGIGKTEPSEKLEVAGNIKASGTICDSKGCIGSGEGSGTDGGGVSFGDWTNQGTLATGGTETLVKDHGYVAQTDGFVTAYGASYNTIGIQTPDGTTRCTISLGHGNDKTGNLCPVKKGDTWKVVSNVAGALTIYWIPLVSGGGGSGSSLPTCSNGQILKYNSATGKWECADGGGSGGGEGTPPLKFEVYNPDTTTYACVEKDLEEYCGDEDGCTIRLLLQHEIDGTDQVHIIDEHIYMEQTALSNNHGVGIYGWTRQGGGGEYSWITGTTVQYDIAYPWSWVWIKNYKHDWCDGQVGNGPAFTNPYQFSFMSHPHVRTTVIVYDSIGGGSGGGSGGRISCHTVSSTPGGRDVKVYCDYGERTGGGCSYPDSVGGWRRWYQITPIEPNGWWCKNEDVDKPITAYVVCC